MIRSLLCLALLCTLGACHRDVASTETVSTPPVPAKPARPADPAVSTAEPAEPPEQPSEDAQAAVKVVHDYYAAITAHDFERAYHSWGDGPPGQTLAAFTAGFADTASVEATTEKPSRIEGAMGSRYIEVPTAIVATTKTGHTQRFAGTYTLRRTVVDGAPESARTWHLYRASMRPVIDPPSVPE